MLDFYNYFAVLDRAIVTNKGRLSGNATSIVKVIRIAFTSSCTVCTDHIELKASYSLKQP